MATWSEDIALALEQLGGIAPLAEIYEQVATIRPKPHPADLGASVRGAIERNSSDSTVFSGNDLFFSVHGIGGGVWGLRSFEKPTPLASDIDSLGNEAPQRQHQKTYRILRDTALARQIKLLHKNKCQICGESIKLPNGELYSEAHHIQPLGNPHKGPDTSENILVLCPNHHVMLDYGVIAIDPSKLNLHHKHKIGATYITYHNEVIMKPTNSPLK
ncbi:HNH endonuclease [Burkholderia cepacia]|uniref:HNH endonuclease n=2 Tax=Burkholderia cepacia TaxID=292 RepID=A0AAX2RZF3_BURCE|nr:HNH endonuclease [Burkholderia cepacia]TES82867.1 HNH endonuclease [Burkholderia cepacia]TET03916.1 HNH endonuclease [Burkholderia cepacia]TEU50064.1 HNH endonuclease [Burkholderia cepacia]TEU54682.1 HNH endonuclease [Burkholderia cepacia]TEU58551.1 HNH endonuclease [Burkholderia cepacia]